MSRTFELQDRKHARLLPMEGLRGIAVTLVFLQHYGVQAQLIGLSRGLESNVAAAWRIYGNLGVELFFVLSGYLIYGTLIRRKSGFASFMLRRIQRIYPAFLVVFSIMLTLTLAIPIPDKFPQGTLEALLYLCGNLLLLPGLFPITPILAVAWSLSYEVFFYLATASLVLGLGMYRMAQRRRLGFLMVTTALFATGMLLDLPYYPGRMAPFFAGMLLAEGLGRRVPDWLGLLAPVFGCAVALQGLLPGNAGELLQTACFFVLCAACFRGTGLVSRMMVWTPLRWLGNMSYSYYLLHGLIVRIACVMLARVLPGGMPNWLFWVTALGLYAVSLVAAALLFVGVEKPYSLRAPPSKKGIAVDDGTVRAAPSPGS